MLSVGTACWDSISFVIPGAHHSCVLVIVARSSLTENTYARSTAAAWPSSSSAWLMLSSTDVRVGVDEARRDRGDGLVQDPHVAQRLLGLALLRDVPDGEDDAAELVVDRLGVRRDELDLRVGAVRPPQARPDVGPVVLAGQVLGEAQRDVLGVVGVDQREAVHAERGRPAGRRGDGRDSASRRRSFRRGR